MGRPRRLTDEERKRSNAERQARWRAKHLGFARLKDRNEKARLRALLANKKEKVTNAGGVVRREKEEVEETFLVGMDEVEGDKEVLARRMGVRRKDDEERERGVWRTSGEGGGDKGGGRATGGRGGEAGVGGVGVRGAAREDGAGGDGDDGARGVQVGLGGDEEMAGEPVGSAGEQGGVRISEEERRERFRGLKEAFGKKERNGVEVEMEI
jgi:hypothetical protein